VSIWKFQQWFVSPPPPPVLRPRPPYCWGSYITHTHTPDRTPFKERSARQETNIHAIRGIRTRNPTDTGIEYTYQSHYFLDTQEKHATYLFLSLYNCNLPFPVAARSKEWVCDRFVCWDCGFEFRWGQRCSSIVHYQAYISATNRSLIRSPSECGVSECDRVVSKMRGPRPTTAVGPLKKNWEDDFKLSWTTYLQKCGFYNSYVWSLTIGNFVYRFRFTCQNTQLNVLLMNEHQQTALVAFNNRCC
jgi:hypothetical protein